MVSGFATSNLSSTSLTLAQVNCGSESESFLYDQELDHTDYLVSGFIAA